MSWDSILGHQREIDKLRRGSAGGRLAHAYAFIGPAGIGKYKFARQFAQCLLCENHADADLEACGTCASCQQVEADTHPDLLTVLLPEGKRELPLHLFIGEKESRGKAGLCYDVTRKPMSARRRVAIINDADAMNEESSNALLKTLEEPPPHSVLILISASADGLLSTIRSRCQIVSFQSLTAADLQTIVLKEGMTADPKEAAQIASLAEGSVVAARQLLDPKLRGIQSQLYNLLAAQPFRSNEAASQMIEHVESAGSEKSSQREAAGWIIRFCVEFFRGALLSVSAGGVSKSGSSQVAAFISQLPSATLDAVDRLIELVERSLVAEQHLSGNAAIPLCLEAFFNDLGRIIRGA